MRTKLANKYNTKKKKCRQNICYAIVISLFLVA